MTIRFENCGNLNMVCVNRVIGIIPIGTATAKLRITEAKANGTMIDATLGKKHQSIVLLDNGTTIISPLTCKTLRARFNGAVMNSQYDDDLAEIIEPDDEEEMENDFD